MADVARLDPGKGLASATESYARSKAYATSATPNPPPHEYDGLKALGVVFQLDGFTGNQFMTPHREATAGFNPAGRQQSWHPVASPRGGVLLFGLGSGSCAPPVIGARGKLL